MTAQQLQELFLSQPSYRELLRQLENRGTTVGLDSLVGSSYSLVAAGAVRERGGVHVFVMEDRDAAGYLYNDLSPFLDEERLLFFPTAYKRSIQFGQEDPSGIVQRTAALNAVKNFTDGYLAICTYPEALVEKVVGMQRLRESILTIRVGDTLSTSTIEEILADNGFERVEFVYEPGQYSVRGGIVDIFSFSDNKPYRIDLFGDEVDSIRHFDLSSQLSVDRLQQIEVVPNLKDAVSGRERVSFPAFAAGATYWLDDGEYTLKRFQDIRTKLLGELDDPAQIDTLVTGRKGFLADTAGATMVLLKDNCQERAADATISFHTSPQPQFNKKFELLADDIRDNREKGYTTCLLTENKAQIERLRNIFNSMGERDVPFEAVGVTLHAGFIDHASRYCFYTDHQLFDRYHRYQIRGGIDRSESLTIQELNELKVGDYVVHIDHGVGRFGGLTRNLHQAELRQRQDRMLGAVGSHQLAHLLDQRIAVFTLVQVDKVDHDNPPHVPQPQLARDLGRRREVHVHRRALLVVVDLRTVAAVDIHDVERFGALDDQVGTLAQRYILRKEGHDLLRHVEVVENRNVALV